MSRQILRWLRQFRARLAYRPERRYMRGAVQG
jgi:hypothetical protein